MYGDSPSQFSIFRKIPAQNVFNFVHNYKIIPNFSDDELGKKKCYIQVNTEILKEDIYEEHTNLRMISTACSVC
jgi:hypothetical protein